MRGKGEASRPFYYLFYSKLQIQRKVQHAVGEGAEMRRPILGKHASLLRELYEATRKELDRGQKQCTALCGEMQSSVIFQRCENITHTTLDPSSASQPVLQAAHWGCSGRCTKISPRLWPF